MTEPTEQEKTLAIAKWQFPEYIWQPPEYGGMMEDTVFGISNACLPVVIYAPKYFSDLNAMHEAEEKLSEHQAGDYNRALDLVTIPEFPITITSVKAYSWHATSRQRANTLYEVIKEVM